MQNRHDKRKRRLSWHGCTLLLIPSILLVATMVAVPLVRVGRYYALSRQLDATGSYIMPYAHTYPTEKWLAPFLPTRFASIGESASNREFETVAQFQSVEYLKIECAPSASGMRDVATLPELVEIKFELQGKRIPSAVLGELKACRSLRVLELSGSLIDDGSFSDIDSLQQLTRLTLVEVAASDKTLQKIVSLPNLSALIIADCEGFTDDGMQSLNSAKNLQILNVAFSPVGDTILNAVKNSEIYDLTLRDTGCTDKGFAQIVGLQNLNSLYIDREEISDKALLKVAKLRNLKHLYIWDCKNLTRASVDKLESQMPDCEISVISEFEPHDDE